MTIEKIRENRLRRMAERQGLRLMKSPRRDPHADHYGTYMLVDASTNAIVATASRQNGYGLDLDQIEVELTMEASDKLLYANLSIERIDRALRQLDRLQDTYAAWVNEKEQRDFQGGVAPIWWVEGMTAVEDQQYFTIIAVNHALKAVDVLRQLGEEVPKVRQDPELAAWRDIAEHWDDPVVKGKAIRALSRWEDHSDESEPGLTYASDGDELTSISGVDLRQLAADLRVLRNVAGQASERHWDETWLTETQTAQVMGLSLDQFRDQSVHPLRYDFGDDGGIRYQRESVEALASGGHAGLREWLQRNELL
jgi:hypothetical protein